MPRMFKNSHQWSVQQIKIYSDADQINFETPYQRNEVWNNTLKSLLIDSLMRGYDIPKLYVESNSDDGNTFDVVDGQQRLKSIIKYMNNEFALSNNDAIADNWRGKKYEDLESADKVLLNRSSMDCVELVDYSEDQIRDMFQRLQLGSALNTQEKLRIMPGNFPEIVQDLSTHSIFSLYFNSGNNRYSWNDCVAKILHILLKGNGHYCSTGSAVVKKTYVDHSDITSTNSSAASLKKAFNCLNKSLNEYPPTKAYSDPSKYSVGKRPLKKWSMITLSRLLITLDEEFYLTPGHKKKIAKIFNDFNKARDEVMVKDEDDLTDEEARLYNLAPLLRSDVPANMKSREDYLRELFLEEFGDLKPKDERRLFNELERSVILRRSSENGDGNPPYKCHLCDATILPNNFDADHIMKHSEAGPTTVDNGRALCVTCNRSRP